MSVSHDALTELVSQLADLRGSDRMFNPYRADQDRGASIRAANLARYLADMATRQPDTLMLFEAPGYRGCALSGIPVTSERIMLGGIPKWELFGPSFQATSGQAGGVSEMTATILWGALQQYADAPPLIWNTVPLHPHRPGDRRSNRTPSRLEQEMGLPYIREIMSLFNFRQVLAVGRIAQAASQALGINAIPLRHPAQGGKTQFITGLAAVFQPQTTGNHQTHDPADSCI